MTFLLFIGEFLRAIGRFLKACPSFIKEHQRAFYICLAIAVLIAVAILFHGCFVDHEQQKITDGQNNSNSAIFQANTNSGIIEGEKEKRDNEVKNAQKQTQPALENVNRARATDSRDADTDAGAAARRFCQSYPNDSRCLGNAQ